MQCCIISKLCFSHFHFTQSHISGSVTYLPAFCNVCTALATGPQTCTGICSRFQLLILLASIYPSHLIHTRPAVSNNWHWRMRSCLAHLSVCTCRHTHTIRGKRNHTPDGQKPLARAHKPYAATLQGLWAAPEQQGS